MGAIKDEIEERSRGLSTEAAKKIEIMNAAAGIYWRARGEGRSENTALSLAVDHVTALIGRFGGE